MEKSCEKIKCILCHSDKVILKEELLCSDLESLYEKKFGLSISENLKQAEKINYYLCKNCGLLFFNPDFAGNARFYEDLQKHRKVYYNPNRVEFSFSQSLIKDKESVLEIGSGSGFFATKISKANYTGLEFNDKAIEEASKRGIKLIKKSIELFEKETKLLFDVVCSFHVLEHVGDPFNFLNSATKVLKKNGKLILSVPNNLSKLTNNANHVLNLPPHHITRWNLKTLEHIGLLFDLELINFKTHNIGSSISKKEYFKVKGVDYFISIFYPKNKVLLNPDKYDKIKKYSDFIIEKMKLYHLQDKEKMIGENITVVFKKTV